MRKALAEEHGLQGSVPDSATELGDLGQITASVLARTLSLSCLFRQETPQGRDCLLCCVCAAPWTVGLSLGWASLDANAIQTVRIVAEVGYWRAPSSTWDRVHFYLSEVLRITGELN